MVYEKHGSFLICALFRKETSLALSLGCAIALASCGGLQKSLKKEVPPVASVEGTLQGWQFVPEKFPSQGEQADKAVVYFHRDMSAFSCQAFNVNKNRSQGKLRVIKKAKNRKQGWRAIRLKGSSSWDPTRVVCDESTTPPYALGSDAQGKVVDLGKGKPAPIPNAFEKERGWKLVSSDVSKEYETRTRSVLNPRYDPRKVGSQRYITEQYRVQIGHSLLVVVYLYGPAFVTCTARQEFRGSILKEDSSSINGSLEGIGWFRSRFVFRASQEGTYGFPVSCE